MCKDPIRLCGMRLQYCAGTFETTRVLVRGQGLTIVLACPARKYKVDKIDETAILSRSNDILARLDFV